MTVLCAAIAVVVCAALTCGGVPASCCPCIAGQDSGGVASFLSCTCTAGGMPNASVCVASGSWGGYAAVPLAAPGFGPAPQLHVGRRLTEYRTTNLQQTVVAEGAEGGGGSRCGVLLLCDSDCVPLSAAAAAVAVKSALDGSASVIVVGPSLNGAAPASSLRVRRAVPAEIALATAAAAATVSDVPSLSVPFIGSAGSPDVIRLLLVLVVCALLRFCYARVCRWRGRGVGRVGGARSGATIVPDRASSLALLAGADGGGAADTHESSRRWCGHVSCWRWRRRRRGRTVALRAGHNASHVAPSRAAVADSARARSGPPPPGRLCVGGGSGDGRCLMMRRGGGGSSGGGGGGARGGGGGRLTPLTVGLVLLVCAATLPGGCGTCTSGSLTSSTSVSGYTFDLTPLVLTVPPAYISLQSGGQNYYFNLCAAMSDPTKCSDAGFTTATVCQCGAANCGTGPSCGTYTAPTWALLNPASPCSGVSYFVGAGDAIPCVAAGAPAGTVRDTTIQISCNMAVATITVGAATEPSICHYFIQAASKYGCCAGCPSGQAPVNGVCTSCGAGTKSVGPGATACAACTCSVGYASTATGQSACGTNVAPCNACAAGQACAGLGTQPGLPQRKPSVIVVFAFAYPRLARWRTCAVLGKLWFLFFLSAAFMASEFPCADTLRGHS